MSCGKEKTLDDWAMAAMQGSLSCGDQVVEDHMPRFASFCFNIAEAMQAESRKRREAKELVNTVEVKD